MINSDKLNQRLVKTLNLGLIIIFLTMPFYAFITVFFSSIVGHYTLIRLYKEIIVLILTLISIYLVIVDKKLRNYLFKNKLIWLIIVFAFLVIIWGLVAYLKHGVSAKALGYGLIVDLRTLLIFVICYLLSFKLKIPDKKIIKLIIYPALIVIIFAMLQIFVLPNNFLSHFGYNIQTIKPYETINSNKNYVRIIATLRGANPLGAYLVIPISLLAVLFYSTKRRYLVLVSLIMAFLALFFSFSRSAWIGAILALIVIFYVKLPSNLWRKRALFGGLLMTIIFIISLLLLHNNPEFDNIFFHTQNNSKAAYSSNAGHLFAFESGIKQLITQPLGKGTGTAGPASVYNIVPPRISENFYIQIGQELGWLGLIIYLWIQFIILKSLWRYRDNKLVLAFTASFIGISFINLLSFAWADDTMAYIFWGFAGLIISKQNLLNDKN